MGEVLSFVIGATWGLALAGAVAAWGLRKIQVEMLKIMRADRESLAKTLLARTAGEVSAEAVKPMSVEDRKILKARNEFPPSLAR
jgi:hypothetical protein